MHLTELYIVYMANLHGPEKICDICRKKCIENDGYRFHCTVAHFR